MRRNMTNGRVVILDYLEKLIGNHIVEAYEVIKEFEVFVGFQKIKIKIKLGNDGKYYYATSHYYHGSRQAGPYTSSQNGFDTIENAIYHAKRQILQFYDPNDESAVWKINDNY